MRKALLLFIVLACLAVGKSYAQSVPAWGRGLDQQDFSFGFTFQYLQSDFKIVKNPNWRQPFIDRSDPAHPVQITDSLSSIRSKGLPGFGIGFLARYSINQYIEIRTTPSLIFSDKQILYTYRDASQNVQKQIQSTSFDVPMLLKIKSDRIGDFRMYLLGGAKVSTAINKKPDDADQALTDKLVKLKRNYASYEVGIGCDIYFEYFKLSPELKLSNSIGNVLLPENHPYSSPISKLFMHTFMISLYFE
ncbi:PorT family protein [Mucilaginibacter sp. RS28]|uniref:PorT family protein n=1 Tax=Mucilaginibacter straminoryzae TaxID=2932774 RepID=A0A9X1X4C9_9SPHI|nr:outer membrane beta-barrel protein [Mucilaginibacter straminoryzae]MCJ8210155.1 PorT family protein [Mucilaginibacter straminoryzae]